MAKKAEVKKVDQMNVVEEKGLALEQGTEISTEPIEVVDSQVCAQLPQEEKMYELADLFKVFGDSTRIKILLSLNKNEMCVQDIAEMVTMSQSATSHQLKVLKQNKLVKSRREGKQIFYSLDDEHVNQILCMGLEHVLE